MIDEFETLPHAQGPEKYVLSVLMKDPERRAETPLDEDIFYQPAHRIIYREMMKAGDGFELVGFVEGLHKRGILDSAGGPATITEAYTYAPHAASFDRHLAEVRDCHCRRMAIAAARSALEAAFDRSGEEGAKNYLEALSGPVTALFDYAAGAKPTAGMKQLAADFLAEFEAKLSGKALPDGIMTGIPDIDRALHGMKPQHMGIISGPPGAGKSTLATQIFATGSDALYLILERTEKSAFGRCVVQASRVHHGAVFDPKAHAELNGRTNPEKQELMAIRDALTRLTDSNLHIVKPTNRRLATIAAEIRRYVRRNKVRTVFLDQIGLVRGERIRGDSGEAVLRGVSNALQELAHELGISLVVLCQVNADGDTKNARAIEEDADWWLSIIVERDKKKDTFGQHQHVLVAKDSHHGNAGERLPLILDKETLRFVHGFPATKDDEKPKPKGRASFGRGIDE